MQNDTSTLQLMNEIATRLIGERYKELPEEIKTLARIQIACRALSMYFKEIRQQQKQD